MASILPVRSSDVTPRYRYLPPPPRGGPPCLDLPEFWVQSWDMNKKSWDNTSKMIWINMDYSWDSHGLNG